MINVFGNGTVVCLSTESTELLPIRVNNTGGQVITNMILTVNIPDGLAYESHTASTGTFDGVDTWTIASIGVGNSATLDICFTVTDDTLGPWEITYTAVHDASADSIPTDDAAERNVTGFACSEFENCWAVLQEFGSMDDAIAELGPNKLFLASLDNVEGWSWRTVLLTYEAS